jgi:hypothetical protein
MTETFANNASSTLNGSITNSDLTLIVTSAASFPASARFRLLLGTNPSTGEIVLVTGVAGTTFTILRAQEGTSASSWPNATAVTHILTAGAINQLKQDVYSSNVIVDELDFTSANNSTGLSTFQRIGGRSIDLSLYSLTLGTLNLSMNFIADVQKTSGATTVEVKLVDVTHNATITGTNLTSSSNSLAKIEATALTIGTSSGNIRTDVVSEYEIQLKMNGGTVNDQVFCTNVRLLILYV